MKTGSRACFSTAAVVFLAGLIFTVGVYWMSDVRMIPADLADIYREEQHSLTVPGSMELQLNRTGAYGIYYHYSLAANAWEEMEIPPEIECSLTSEAGKTCYGVADYVRGNHFWEKENGGPAVLIQSISIDEPGKYTFSCRHLEGGLSPSFKVSLGPNYVWEMMRLVLKNGLALLLLIFSLPTAILIAILLSMAGLISGRKSRNRIDQGDVNEGISSGSA